MPATYMPKAPNGGTDDYRCFLLDPKLTRDSFVTGYDVEPGDASIVHHVILYRVPASKVALARAPGRPAPGDGWTCFGGTGIERQGASLDDAPWVGVGAGRTETILAPDLGIPMEKDPGWSCRSTTTCSMAPSPTGPAWTCACPPPPS